MCLYAIKKFDEKTKILLKGAPVEPYWPFRLPKTTCFLKRFITTNKIRTRFKKKKKIAYERRRNCLCAVTRGVDGRPNVYDDDTERTEISF